MDRWMVELVAWFAGRQHGVVARWQLLDAQLPVWAIDNLVKRGELIAVHLGVYRLRGAPITREMRWHAATLAVGERGVLSRRAAAAHHGLAGIRRFRPEVTGPYSRLPIISGVDVHRSRNLSERDIVVKDGIRVTTVARTLLECCSVLPYDKVEHATQQAVIRKQVARRDLWIVLDRVGGRGFEGSVAFREIATGDATDATIQSALELVLKRIVDRAAVPQPQRQVPFTCGDGRHVVLDSAWLDYSVCVEADGLRWHGTAKQLRETRARSRSIQNSGLLHLVYGWADCHDDAELTRREIERALHERIRRAA
jgi:hypothetical protein